MGKKVTFYLGPAVGLSQRNFKITRFPNAADGVTMPSATSNQNLSGSAESVSVSLADNTLWQAILTDTKSTGEVSQGIVLNFNTGSLQFPGPASDPSVSLLRVLAMEDLSSSSSQSSSSSSSQSSSSSSASSASSSSQS